MESIGILIEAVGILMEYVRLLMAYVEILMEMSKFGRNELEYGGICSAMTEIN